MENNCKFSFSFSGCHVQDQVSRKVSRKGPKWGRLFPLCCLRIRPCFPYFAIILLKMVALWHKCLGQPNACELFHMLNNGLLLNKQICSFQDLLFDCTTCKSTKSKSLPFSSHANISTNCFDLIHTNVWGINAPSLIPIINICYLHRWQ